MNNPQRKEERQTMIRNTDVKEFLQDLNGGVFEEKLSAVLSSVAMAVITEGKAGKVAMTFTIEQIGNSHQVAIKHSLNYKKPTLRGHTIEQDETQTPMHVGQGGKMTLFPEGQELLFDKTGQPTNQKEE